MKRENEISELISQINKILHKRKNGRRKIIGSVRHHKSFLSESLQNKRDIIVWLPPSYNKRPDMNFPVLYMHDGQNIMDPSTAFAGADWRVDETAYSLIRQNRMQEIIIVGINNSPDRLEEYSDSLKGILYLKFLINELKPFIDKTYRTLPDNLNTGIIGSSMGGLCSLLAVWNHPEVFSKGACLSSSFHFNNQAAIKLFNEYEGKKKPVRIYLDSGEDGKDETQIMFSALTKKGFIIGEDLDYFYDRGGQHTESDWAARLERPLIFLFGR